MQVDSVPQQQQHQQQDVQRLEEQKQSISADSLLQRGLFYEEFATFDEEFGLEAAEFEPDFDDLYEKIGFDQKKEGKKYDGDDYYELAKDPGDQSGFAKAIEITHKERKSENIAQLLDSQSNFVG